MTGMYILLKRNIREPANGAAATFEMVDGAQPLNRRKWLKYAIGSKPEAKVGARES